MPINEKNTKVIVYVALEVPIEFDNPTEDEAALVKTAKARASKQFGGVVNDYWITTIIKDYDRGY